MRVILPVAEEQLPQRVFMMRTVHFLGSTPYFFRKCSTRGAAMSRNFENASLRSKASYALSDGSTGSLAMAFCLASIQAALEETIRITSRVLSQKGALT